MTKTLLWVQRKFKKGEISLNKNSRDYLTAENVANDRIETRLPGLAAAEKTTGCIYSYVHIRC